MSELMLSPQSMTLNYFDESQLKNIQRAAKMFSNSDLVPDMYKVGGKLNNTEEKAMANCIIALEMGQRINASPLMVMQHMIIIYGRPSWSSTFLIATVNTCGRFEPLKFKFNKKGKVGKIGNNDFTQIDNVECIAYTKPKGGNDDEILESSPIDLEMAIKEGWYTKNGSKWQTMPKQMLMYRAASFWVRAYAPEISMGMQTAEELQDIRTVDAEFEIVEKKVENEIHEQANKTVFEMPKDEPATAPEPVKATPQEAFEVAEAPTEIFPEEKPKSPRF